MRKFRKETKGRTHDPILTHPECGHWGDEPNGGGWGGGWMDIGAKKKFEKFLHIILSPPQRLNYSQIL